MGHAQIGVLWGFNSLLAYSRFHGGVQHSKVTYLFNEVMLLKKKIETVSARRKTQTFGKDEITIILRIAKLMFQALDLRQSACLL